MTKKSATGKSAAARKKPLTPKQSAAQIRALLEAKKQRVRQGPTWPAANAHTGQLGGAGPEVDHDLHDTAVAQTSPESNFGVAGMHGRGNQGKRGQN
ncbi:hypothetical protein [Dokdonella sp.]|uniref:hypothetical protein n=1 Tax=Dokdonella sp. TaxID=2291710 RepID=UPI003C4153C0